MFTSGKYQKKIRDKDGNGSDVRRSGRPYHKVNEAMTGEFVVLPVTMMWSVGSIITVMTKWLRQVRPHNGACAAWVDTTFICGDNSTGFILPSSMKITALGSFCSPLVCEDNSTGFILLSPGL